MFKTEGPPTNAAFKNVVREGNFFDKKQPSPTSRNIPQGKPFRQKKPSPSWQNSITREAQLAAPNRTATPLPEVHATFRLTKLPVPPSKLPFHPTFEILHLPAGTFRSDARRKPVPFDAPFAADGDMATVTWSNLPERLKGRKRGVNCPADA
ncbi:hypothetical protein B5G27_05470 [Lachnoclostridium sp. An76]|nr:hypothetical protein B5G27_05470 [Lachnoclostridium sp. An76]